MKSVREERVREEAVRGRAVSAEELNANKRGSVMLSMFTLEGVLTDFTGWTRVKRV